MKPYHSTKRYWQKRVMQLKWNEEVEEKFAKGADEKQVLANAK